MEASFDDFIGRIRNQFHCFFSENKNLWVSGEKRLTKELWKKLNAFQPLSVAIPTEYGGRGINLKECFGVLSTASYESLSLSLTLGINIGLFLEPLSKYGGEEIKRIVFKQFLNNNALGGLMITEPAHGTDALNMKTRFEEKETTYHLQGEKHWQGLTGLADFWIVAAREKRSTDTLSRDISLFMAENGQPGQEIEVTELYDNLGLKMIPYGRNKVDIHVPKRNQFQPPQTGIKMMLDILHRSRMQFPGMGMGFIKRLLDETVKHCQQRKIGGKFLSELDKVRLQLSRMQFAYTLCSGMCAHGAAEGVLEKDLSDEVIEANSTKALVTDLMHETAQISAQLFGADGYKISHLSGQGILDSRPFRIFEGPNEMLYTQIAQKSLKVMRRKGMTCFFEYLSSLSCHPVVKSFKELLQFNPGMGLPQRKLVVLGEIVARLVCLQYVFNMVEKGFRQDLYDHCESHIRADIQSLLSGFFRCNEAAPLYNYEEGSAWSDFV